MITRRTTAALLALLLGLAALHADDRETKIIGYNILLGFNRAARIEVGAAYLAREKPDVVLFQEVARQNGESFARLARMWGHSYAAVAKPWQDYSIGITSKRPFEMLEIRTDGMHHGYILAKIDGVYYMSIHYSPFSYKVRITESEVYAKRLKPLIDAGEKVIMMGDFNNPSPHDAAQANNNATALEIRRNEKDPKIENIREGFFDFTCINNLLKLGLVEICYTWMRDNNYKPWIGVRIDMALITPNLTPLVTRAFVDVRDREMLESVSDHYPVILTLKNLDKESAK